MRGARSSGPGLAQDTHAHSKSTRRSAAQIIGEASELIEPILEVAAREAEAERFMRWKWLARLMLVSKTWNPIAELLLYRSIDLVAPVPIYSARLVKRLKEDLRICQLVQDVICLPNDDNFQKSSSSSFQDLFLFMLPRLKNTASLTIDLTRSSWSGRRIRDICPSGAECSKLTTLYLRSVTPDLLLDLLNAAPALLHLDVWGCYTDTPGRNLTEPELRLPELRLRSISFDVELRFSVAPVQLVEKLLRKSATSIEHIRAIRGMSIALPIAATEQVLPNLKTLALHEMGEVYDDYLPIQRLPPPSEELRLSFNPNQKMKWTASHLHQMRILAAKLPATCRVVFEGRPLPHGRHMATFFEHVKPILDSFAVRASVLMTDPRRQPMVELGRRSRLYIMQSMPKASSDDLEGLQRILKDLPDSDKQSYVPSRTSIDPRTAYRNGEISLLEVGL